MTARLTNPHTVSIYDFGRTPDGALLLRHGVPRRRRPRGPRARERPVAPGPAVRILRQVCAALAEAHGIGLIHRDIKPANIFLCERGGIPDIAKVLDFGLVREISTVGGSAPDRRERPARHAAVPRARGDPRRGARSTPRSDLYALGAVGYFLLTGTPVFAGKSPLETIHHHLQTQPEPLSRRLGRPVPPELEALILRVPLEGPGPAARERAGARRGARGLRRRSAVGRARRAALLARARARKNAAKTA